jgi:hypothetical protein
MKHFFLVAVKVFSLITIFYSLNQPVPASAGFMDKINAATQKINQANQQLKQIQQITPKAATKKSPPANEDPDRPLHLEDHYEGSCEGKRSATCMDYMELAGQCMDPLKGYRSKLMANLIEKKLKNDTTLNSKLRKNLEEDLIGLREAEKNKSDEPTIAGEVRSSRHLMDISEEDQLCVNADYGVFYKKIYNKCMGADHMGIGRRTEMMQDQETMGCEEAVAEFRAKRKKEAAPMECLKGISGLRWQVMAEMMEAKMNKINPSGKERENWEADITSIRDTAEKGAAMPTPADPSNPTRYMLRLTTEEQVLMMQEYSTRSQIESTRCSQISTQPEERKPKSTGLVDHSKSPANKNAQKSTKKTYADLNKGRGGSTNLLALRRDNVCYDQLIGHFAKVHAEALEKKMKTAKGLSAQDRKEWDEDIASWRAAEAAGVDNPEPADPQNPYRWQDRLTREECQQINMTHNNFNTKIIKECGNRDAGL